MNNFYRAMVALSTVIPLTIPFAFIFAEHWQVALSVYCPEYFNPVFVGVTLVALANWVVGYAMVWILDIIANRKLGRNVIRVESVRLLGGDSMMGYLPYVLPLFITQSNMQPIIGWVIGAVVLLLLALLSSTIPFSPLLKICGLQFYEAQLADCRTVTLLIRNKKLRPLRLKKGVSISDYCIYGVE